MRLPKATLCTGIQVRCVSVNVRLSYFCKFIDFSPSSERCNSSRKRTCNLSCEGNSQGNSRLFDVS